MRHVLLIGKGACCWVVDGRTRLTEKRVVLHGAARDEGAAIGEDHHAVAEHVPCHRLRGDGPSLRIP